MIVNIDDLIKEYKLTQSCIPQWMRTDNKVLVQKFLNNFNINGKESISCIQLCKIKFSNIKIEGNTIFFQAENPMDNEYWHDSKFKYSKLRRLKKNKLIYSENTINMLLNIPQTINNLNYFEIFIFTPKNIHIKDIIKLESTI